MKSTQRLTLLSVILILLFHSAFAQSSISYTPLKDYATNFYFQIANQTLYRAYGSYLSKSTINLVSIYTSSYMISIEIIYKSQIGTLYRGVGNYLPITRQLNIQSFGPVVQSKTTGTSGMMSTTPPIRVYE